MNDFMNNNINLLNQLHEARAESYFALTTILITIAVFSAGLISGNKKSIEKRMMVKKLPIKQVIFTAMMITILLWVEPLFNNNLIIEVIIDFGIIYSFIDTGLLLRNTIELSSNDLKYMKELDSFITNRTRDIEKKNNDNKKICDKKMINEKLVKYNCKIDEENKWFLSDEYASLKSNFEGFVKDINWRNLPKKTNDEQDVESTLYLNNIVGRYVENGEEIGSCNRRFKKQYIDMEKYFVINKKTEYYIKQYNEIINYYFQQADKDISSFDNNNTLKNYYLLLSQNNYRRVISLFNSQIKEHFYKINNNVPRLTKYHYFLKGIRRICLENDDSHSYETIDEYVMLYYYLFLKKADREQVSIIKSAISTLLYSLRYYNNIYYDYSLSNILKLLFWEIKDEKYELIYYLIKDNYVLFNRYDANDKNINVCNQAFFAGLIKALFTIKKRGCSNRTSELIDKIYNYIKTEIDKPDGIELIHNYKQIEIIAPSIYKVMDNCEMHIDEHEDGAKFSVNEITENELLMYLFDVFNCVYFDPKSYKKEIYQKEDKYFYLELKKIYNESDIKKQIPDNNIEKGNIIDFINYAIEECQKIEHEYLKSAKIKNEILIDFEKNVFANSFSIKSILSQLKTNNKIIFQPLESKDELKSITYIPREFFIQYDIFKELLIDHYRDYFTYFIINKYYKYINENFPSYNNVEEVESLVNENYKYIIIMNENLYFDKYFHLVQNDFIKVNNINIPCYCESSEIIGIKLINVDNLPELLIDSKSIDSNRINILATHFDLSDNEVKRKEILNHSQSKTKEDSLVIKVLYEFKTKIKIN